MPTSPQTEKRTLSESCFSLTYSEARRRFAEAATRVGAEIHSYPIEVESSVELAIDVAILGAEGDASIVVSSGVHGVEGFLGSAVQLALLERLNDKQPVITPTILNSEQDRQNIRYVLIHGLNPYGFSRLRRFNEDNVDLNRNFLSLPEEYSGAPAGYAGLNGLLNPESPPSRFEPFTLKAVWNVWRTGLQPLKETVAAGQYEYPRGLFFGGSAPCQSTRIVTEHCDSWLATSPKIVHIDFHSGLGPFGTYKLLLTALDSADYAWYAEAFGTDPVEPLTQANGTAYPVKGQFGEWMQRHFKPDKYRFVIAEFGTYCLFRVLKAVRAENRAHHYNHQRSPRYQWSKRALLECFCPQAPSWRRNAVESGIRIIEQANQALSRR